jgi:hypothetical protein
MFLCKYRHKRGVFEAKHAHEARRMAASMWCVPLASIRAEPVKDRL